MSQPPLKVTLIGANGHLGPSILSALQTSPTPIDITILTRQSSKSTYPPTLTVKPLPDTLPTTDLTTALTGQDVLVISITGSLRDTSLKLIRAAVDARVSRIIPADFGSCDSSDPRTLSLIPLYPDKKAVRDTLVELCAGTGGQVSWTSVVCGHFLDYGLKSGLMSIDVEKRRARRFDGGDVHFSASVLRTVGRAVLGVLTHLAETRDRIVYVQSVRTTQNELLAVVERVVGGERFTVEDWDSGEFIREWQVKLRERPGDHEVTEDLVSVEGIVNADWARKETFMNGLFGLPEESLEDIVREALK